MASSIENPAWVEWMATLMGGRSRQAHAATLPPDCYYCLLDELPLHLIPRYGLDSLRNSADGSQRLVLNPECILCAAGQLPEELEPKRELLSGFALQGMIAWVRDAATNSLLPFWLGPKLEVVIGELQRDEAATDALPQEVQTLLAGAGILIFVGQSDKCDRRSEQKVARSRTLFRETGYAPLHRLIHPFHIAALRRYYRYLIRTGAIRLGDGQSPRRYVAYNEPVARFFHHQMADLLGAVAGEPLKPSYVYLASYLSGAELKKHTDREQCEFSITLCLDFSPEPRLETPWPIRLETARGSVAVYQGLGDGLAYCGTKLPHYRDMLGKGQTSTSIFFHYVSADFPGSLA